MTDAEREAIKAKIDERRARLSLPAFAQRVFPSYEMAPHSALIMDTLQRIESGEIRRLVLSQPPQTGKSTALNIFAAYCLGKDPSRRIVTASYGEELADRNSRFIRGLIDSAEYPFDVKLDPSSRAAHRFNLAGHRGSLLAVGAGSGLTGFSADGLILDDLVKSSEEASSQKERQKLEEWLGQVAFTRLSKNAFVVLAGTRWAFNDIMSTVLEGPDAHKWHVLNLSALSEGPETDPLGRPVGQSLWPAWKSEDDLAEMRTRLGSRPFSSLYQGKPVPDNGDVFKSEWFSHTFDEHELPANVVTFFTMDTALSTGVSANYSVIMVWSAHQGALYLRNVIRDKFTYPQLKAKLIETAKTWNPGRIFIEKASSGISILQELQYTWLPLIPVPTGHESKQTRAESITGLLEAGKLKLPKHAHWKDALITEALRFPVYATDDMVDTLVMAFRKLSEQMALEDSRNRQPIRDGYGRPIVGTNQRPQHSRTATPIFQGTLI